MFHFKTLCFLKRSKILMLNLDFKQSRLQFCVLPADNCKVPERPSLNDVIGSGFGPVTVTLKCVKGGIMLGCWSTRTFFSSRTVVDSY